ncbi:hypothetical protein MASR2M70_17550 [Bacillota bacterium]
MDKREMKNTYKALLLIIIFATAFLLLAIMQRPVMIKLKSYLSDRVFLIYQTGKIQRMV